MALERVFYIDDEADIRELAELALAELGGLQVDTYDSGLALLQSLPSVAPDLVLLDLHMPGLDGQATLEALRQKPGYEDIPAVFLTAQADTTAQASLRAMGRAEVVPKPFDPVGLADQLKAIWERLGD